MNTNANIKDIKVELPLGSVRKAFVPPAIMQQGTLTIQAGSINLWERAD